MKIHTMCHVWFCELLLKESMFLHQKHFRSIKWHSQCLLTLHVKHIYWFKNKSKTICRMNITYSIILLDKHYRPLSSKNKLNWSKVTVIYDTKKLLFKKKCITSSTKIKNESPQLFSVFIIRNVSWLANHVKFTVLLSIAVF